MLETVMNNPNCTSTDPTAPPPPPPAQPPRSSFSCERHPIEQFTGFCPSCLCERLTTLDSNANCSPSSSRRASSASAAIKSLFSAAAKPYNPPPPPPPQQQQKPSFLHELRRTKSFSASKNEALGQFFEPQRKSCDVRGRNTLWSLFSIDDGKKIESFSPNKPVFEETEVDDDEIDDEIEEIREPQLRNSGNEAELGVNRCEIVEEETNLKIKQHIDLETPEKKSSGGGFWAAASVFSKKWHKWRRKQKMKKQNDAALPVEKPISRQFRETQSEIADYGFGRRSCDTDPRFSLDDAARCSFDEPRASWDGYLIGRSFPARMAPMLSVLKDSPKPSRPDMEIPVEQPANEGCIPGGTMQTKEYYSDSSSSRRRKSLDRSGSIRKNVAEIDEVKMASNAKVSPTTADCFHGAKIVGDRELGESNSQHSSSELGSGYRHSSNSLIGERKEEAKKPSRRWSWRIWGFIHRRKDGDEEEKDSRVNGVNGGNGVGRSLSVSWQDLRGVENNGGVGGRLNINMFRSNSSVSMRNGGLGGSFGGSMRKSGTRRGDELVLERNRSARHSSPPGHVDNGLLRFYLTPLRRRGGKIKANGSSSVARSVLRLY